MKPLIVSLGWILLAVSAGGSEGPKAVWTAAIGGWTVSVDREGGIVSLKDEKQREWVIPDQSPHRFLPSILLRTPGGSGIDAVLPADPAMELDGDSVQFSYDVAGSFPFRLEYRVELATVASWPVLKRNVTILPSTTPFAARVEVSMGFNFLSSAEDLFAFVPRQDGLGDTVSLSAPHQWEFPMGASVTDSELAPEEHLAIPMLGLSTASKGYRMTTLSDPYGGAFFSLAGASDDGVMAFQTGDLPLFGPLSRTFWTVFHPGGPERAMEAWYATALADVPPGPEWLHDVAWQHYDYLSHGGRGWFEDLDVVEKHVAKEDRAKVVFTLHGWYDMLGRYTFDVQAGRLDETWTAFPNAPAMKGKGFPTSEPVALSKTEVHQRIRYAKDRGVRVALYFADGLTACEGTGRFAEDRLLAWGGWNGPDTIGKPYTQTPDNPEVYQWYVDYLKALLEEYGQEIDALVWDETFMIRAGAQSPESAAKRVWLAPVMMRLVRDLTQTTTAYRKDLAFLVSDCIGATSDDKSRWLDVPPYAVTAHGCYQDSHSRPSVWPYGVFPNLRNVLWSCNWLAVKNWGWTEFGVQHYSTPVATSSGWLDDKGIARLSETERNAVLQLFEQRKTNQQRLHWLTSPAPGYAERP